MTARTMAEKILADHMIGDDLLFIDLHLVHEVTWPQAFDGLRLAGRGAAARPHARDGRPQRADDAFSPPIGDRLSVRSSTRSTANCEEFGIRFYGRGHRGRASST